MSDSNFMAMIEDNDDFQDDDSYCYESDESDESCAADHLYDGHENFDDDLAINKSLPINCNNRELDDSDLQVLLSNLRDKNQSIPSLSLVNCHLGNKGLGILVGGLATNTSVIDLHLENNQITAGGSSNLIWLFKKNASIQHIYLDGNDIPADDLSQIEWYVKRNQIVGGVQRYLNSLSELPLSEEHMRITKGYIDALQGYMGAMDVVLESSLNPLIVQELYALLNALYCNNLRDWSNPPATLFLQRFMDKHVPAISAAFKLAEEIKTHLFDFKNNLVVYIEKLHAVGMAFDSCLANAHLPEAIIITNHLLQALSIITSLDVEQDNFQNISKCLTELFTASTFNFLDAKHQNFLGITHHQAMLCSLLAYSKIKNIQRYVRTLNSLREYDDDYLLADIRDLADLRLKFDESGTPSKLYLVVTEMSAFLGQLRYFKSGATFTAPTSLGVIPSFTQLELAAVEDDFCAMHTIVQQRRQIEGEIRSFGSRYKFKQWSESFLKLTRDSAMSLPAKLLTEAYGFCMLLKDNVRLAMNTPNADRILEHARLRFNDNPWAIDDRLVSEVENKKIAEISAYAKTVSLSSFENMDELLQHLRELEDVCPSLCSPETKAMLPDILIAHHELLILLKSYQTGDFGRATHACVILNTYIFSDEGAPYQFLVPMRRTILSNIDTIRTVALTLGNLSVATGYLIRNKDLPKEIDSLLEINICNQWPVLSTEFKIAHIKGCTAQLVSGLQIMPESVCHPRLEALLCEISSFLHGLHKIYCLKKYLSELNHLSDYDDTVLSCDIDELENYYPALRAPHEAKKLPRALKEMHRLLCQFKEFKSNKNEALQHWNTLFKTHEIRMLSHRLLPETIPMQSVFECITSTIHLNTAQTHHNYDVVDRFIIKLDSSLQSFVDVVHESNVFKMGHLYLQTLRWLRLDGLSKPGLHDLIGQISTHYHAFNTIDLRTKEQKTQNEDLNEDTQLLIFLEQLAEYLGKLKDFQLGVDINLSKIVPLSCNSLIFCLLKTKIASFEEALKFLRQDITVYLDHLRHLSDYDESVFLKHLKVLKFFAADLVPKRLAIFNHTYFLLQAFAQFKAGDLYLALTSLECVFKSPRLSRFADELFSLILMNIDITMRSQAQQREYYFLLAYSTRKDQSNPLFKMAITAVTDMTSRLQAVGEVSHTCYLDYDDTCVLIRKALDGLEPQTSPEIDLLKFVLTLKRYDDSYAKLLFQSPLFRKQIVENYPDIEAIYLLENYLLSKVFVTTCGDLCNTTPIALTDEMVLDVTHVCGRVDAFERSWQLAWDENKKQCLPLSVGVSSYYSSGATFFSSDGTSRTQTAGDTHVCNISK